MGIDVERHHDFLTYLYVETRKTVCTEYLKHHLLWISVMCFNNKALYLPFATSRNTCPLRKGCDNSSL